MAQKLNLQYFEYIIAHSALTNSEYLSAIIDYYNPSFFENEDVKLILGIVIDFFQKRHVQPTFPEIKTLLKTPSEQELFIRFLKQIKNEQLTANGNIDELYVNTEQFFRERAVTQALIQITTEMQHGKSLDTTVVFDRFQKACNISLIDTLGLDYFEELNNICDSFLRPNNVISTGWKWLDEKIGGGWSAEGKALYVFTGFTNVGKSIFLGNLALNGLRQNKTVLLATLEMPESMYAKRVTSNITGIPINALAQDINLTKESIINFKNTYNSKLIIKEFPTKSMTVHHLSSYIEKLLKRGIKPDILVVDYLNLMKNIHHRNGLYEDVKEISEQLRALTYLYKIPCITASQLNRKGAGVAEPGMETTSESIGLSFTADCQFSIWSDESDRAQGLIHLGIQKNRFGINSGSITLKIDYKTLTITEPVMVPTTLTQNDLPVSSTNDALNKLNETLNN